MTEAVYAILQDSDNLLFTSLGIRLSNEQIKALKTEKAQIKTNDYTLFRINETIVALKNSLWNEEEINNFLSNGKIFKAYADTVCLIELTDNGILEKQGKIIINDANIVIPQSSLRLLLKLKTAKAIDIEFGGEKRSVIAEIQNNTISLIFL